MVSRLTLEGAGLVLSLNDHIDNDPDGGFAALAGLDGFGLPEVDTRWFEGAGDGASYRGARVRSRDLNLPVMVSGASRDAVLARLSMLATVLAPTAGIATLRVSLGTGEEWRLGVVRVGGGSWTWSSEETDSEQWVETTLTLRAPDPFWVREEVALRTIRAAGLGRGLLRPGASLTALRLASGQVIGDVVVENPGDAPAYPVVTLTGPATSATFTSPSGERYTWAGSLAAGQTRTFDHLAGTVVDQAGVNRYAELGASPRFWAIPPGSRTASLAVLGTSSASAVDLAWRPRRWLLF